MREFFYLHSIVGNDSAVLIPVASTGGAVLTPEGALPCE